MANELVDMHKREEKLRVSIIIIKITLIYYIYGLFIIEKTPTFSFDNSFWKVFSVQLFTGQLSYTDWAPRVPAFDSKIQEENWLMIKYNLWE